MTHLKVMPLKYELRQSSMVSSIFATLTLESPSATTEYSSSWNAGHSRWFVSAFSSIVFRILRHFDLVRWRIWFPSKSREPLTLQHGIISRRHESMLVEHQTSWYRGNSLAFLCGGAWLQSRTGHGMHRLRFFVAFISRSRQRRVSPFFHSRFIPVLSVLSLTFHSACMQLDNTVYLKHSITFRNYNLACTYEVCLLGNISCFIALYNKCQKARHLQRGFDLIYVELTFLAPILCDIVRYAPTWIPLVFVYEKVHLVTVSVTVMPQVMLFLLILTQYILVIGHGNPI